MTLGEKLKIARKQAGLSQEQLSEKLGVSRSAVAKWETDNGIPDVDNLKTLSRLLNVSIDYMLDNGEAIDELVMREPYNLSEYGKGGKGNVHFKNSVRQAPNFAEAGGVAKERNVIPISTGIS